MRFKRGRCHWETKFARSLFYCHGVLLESLTSLSGLFLFYCSLSDFFKLMAGSLLLCIFPLTWTLRLNFSLFSFLSFLLPLSPFVFFSFFHFPPSSFASFHSFSTFYFSSLFSPHIFFFISTTLISHLLFNPLSSTLYLSPFLIFLLH